MTAETKKHLLYGGALIVAVVLGIIVYKRYEAGAQSSQAASDQANSDELAYIESLALQNPYGSSAASGSSIALPTAPAQSSIADELASLEQAFGLSPATPASSGGSSSPTATAAAPPQKVSAALPTRGVPGAPSEVAPVTDERSLRHFILNEAPTMESEGVLVA